MRIRVCCTHPDCGQSYVVTEEQLGDIVACQKCKRTFTVQETVVWPPKPQAEHSDVPSAPAAQQDCWGEGRVRGHKSSAGDLEVDTAPKKLARFEIQERLGAGTFGAVYRAYDPMLDRAVALKVPHASTLQCETRRARVLTEAKAAAQLRHPNIIPVYEAGKDGDTYYIASALIEGQTLEDAMAEREFDFHQAAKLVMDLAGAVQYAHHQGVVHRDIKPANIMIDAQGDPLVMDFGLARLEESESKLTQDGAVLGTPAYMPPEQAAGQLDKIDPASDQYSLGVVLYELLCGSTPFSGPPTMVISLVINQEPDSPRKTNPAIPKDLETICLKAMSRDPDHRYPSCHAMAEDLRRWLDGESILARRVSAGERTVRWCRRNPVMAGLTGATALLLLQVVVVAGIAYSRTSRALREVESERTRAESVLGTIEGERSRADTALGTIEGERKRAEHASALTERERKRAEEAIRRETTAREHAEQAEAREAAERKIAAAERQRAKPPLARSEWTTYLLKIKAAHRAWENGDTFGAWRNLDACLVDLRGWEYDYLHTLSNHSPRTLLGHSDAVLSVSFNPDGQRIVSGSSDTTIKVWDVATGKELLTLDGHTDDVTSVSFSPDGRRIVSGSDDKTAKVWNATTGDEIFTFKGHTDAVKCVVFSPDNRQIVTGSADTTARIWDTVTGEKRLTLEGHADEVTSALFLEESRWILSGSTDGTVKLWTVSVEHEKALTVTSVEDILTVEGRSNDLRSFSFHSPGPSWCDIVASSAEVVRKWSSVAGAYWSPEDGHWKETLQVNKRVFSYDMVHPVAVRSISHGHKWWIISGASDGTLRAWGLHYNVTVGRHAGSVTCVAASPAPPSVVSGSKDGTIKLWNLWDTRSGTLLPSTPSLAGSDDDRDAGDPRGVLTASFAPDGQWIQSVLLDENIRRWGVATLNQRLPQQGRSHTLREDGSGLICASFSRDGRWAAGGTCDNKIKVWDTTTGHEPQTFNGHVDEVTSVVFSPNGQQIVSGSSDNTVKVWDVAKGQVLLTLVGHTNGVTSVAFSPDSARIASGSFDRTARIWNATTGQEMSTLHGHGDGVTGVAFSPDGQRIASGSNDKTIMVWDATTGKEQLTLNGHTEAVSCVAFSPDSRRIVSGSEDRTVKLWDTTWGEATLTLYGHTKRVSSVSFSPDGRQIVSASMDNTIRVWDAGVGPDP